MKIEHWERSLFTYLEAAETRPFLWGSFDCCLFAAGAVQAVTGVDVMAQFPQKYSTEEEARIHLEAFGGVGGLFDAALIPLGAKRIGTLYAKRGDLLTLQLPGEAGLEEMGAVCVGRDVMFLTDQGFRTLALTAAPKLAARAWSFD